MDESQDRPDPRAVLTGGDFTDLVGESVTMTAPDGSSFEAELASVDDLSRPDGRHGPVGGRAPFALLFRPKDGHRRPQALYTVAIEGWEPLAIFCATVIGPEGAPALEAVFN